ncbi:DUF317 domain-containing protein [Streptomyces sp. NPDC056178]|uniref:DUF317 domain-containing protein n=1 Tax=unclassified Streptomyces TaxID=2593676 RepID=UPI0035D8DA28
MPHLATDAHVRLAGHPDHPSAVIATLTGSTTYLAQALLSTHGFRPAGEQRMVLARIDHEEHHYAAQAARALREDGITVAITIGLQEDINTEWTWADYPMPWLTRDEVREVSNQTQNIHDDLTSGRLTIHSHAHDGWTTVTVGSYRDGKSVHLHGENHLRQVIAIYGTPREAIEEFQRQNGDACRPGQAPATDTEKRAARAFTEPSVHSMNLPETELHQPETEFAPVYAADPGDHEALLESLFEVQGEWEKYRPWDESTIATHESVTLRVEFVHDAGPRDHNWTVAAYASPVGERLWHATATASTPVEIVRTLLDSVASDSGPAIDLSATVSEQTIAHVTGPLTDSGWKQTVNGRWINWSPPNEDAAGVQFDAFAAQARGSTLPAWMIWGGNTADRPDWALHASPHTPAFALQALTFELAEGQGRRGIPAATSRTDPLCT